jgi:zinc transport system substrate-binding protein
MRIFLSCLCLIAGLGVLPQAAIAGSTIPNILVSAAPLQPMVDALLHGVGHSRLLTRPGQDAHTMMLAPSQAKALAAADIIIVPDLALNSAIEKLVARKGQKGATIIALTDLEGAAPLDYNDHQAWLGDDDTHTNAEPIRDPHLWLDPLRMAAVATPLAQVLGEKLPSQRGALLANARLVENHLRHDVHPNIKAMLVERRGTPEFTSRDFVPFITGHAAYQYFFARYGIKDPGALITRPEDYLGARSSHTMLKQAEKISVRCLIVENDTGATRKIAATMGARIVRLSPEIPPAQADVPVLDWVHDDYDRLLYITAKRFAECL